MLATLFSREKNLLEERQGPLGFRKNTEVSTLGQTEAEIASKSCYCLLQSHSSWFFDGTKWGHKGLDMNEQLNNSSGQSHMFTIANQFTVKWG